MGKPMVACLEAQRLGWKKKGELFGREGKMVGVQLTKVTFWAWTILVVVAVFFGSHPLDGKCEALCSFSWPETTASLPRLRPAPLSFLFLLRTLGPFSFVFREALVCVCSVCV